MALLLQAVGLAAAAAINGSGGDKRPAYENARGRVLVSIWNIPRKTTKSEFHFLMSRVPGVESWQFVPGPGKSSAGYAYCECPTIEDAKETIALLGRFQARGHKFKAGLFDPAKLEIREEVTHILKPEDDGDERRRCGGDYEAGYRRPGRRVKTMDVWYRKPPSDRLGYRPPKQPQPLDESGGSR